MTDQELKHFNKLFDRFILFHNNKKLKNKEVLRFLDMIAYLFMVNVPYTIRTEPEREYYEVKFESPFEEDHDNSDYERRYAQSWYHPEPKDVMIIKHSVGYGTNNTTLSFTIHGKQIPVFCGNRTRKNLLANVKRMFDTLSDQVKCEMYFNGLKINYALTD